MVTCPARPPRSFSDKTTHVLLIAHRPPRHSAHAGGKQRHDVVWSGAYDTFGNCEAGVETVVGNLRLPGQYYDEETGLYYNLNRYYDPKTGRYLQPDFRPAMG